MAGFEGWNNAFGAAQVVEGIERFLIGDADILRAANLLQPGVLRANARVVQAGADTMGFSDLPIVILQDEGAIAV